MLVMPSNRVSSLLTRMFTLAALTVFKESDDISLYPGKEYVESYQQDEQSTLQSFASDVLIIVIFSRLLL